MPTNVPNISVLRPDEYTIGRAASPANVHAEFQQLVARANLLLHHLREHRGDIDEQVVGLQAAIARVVTLEATVIVNAQNIQENYDFLYDMVQDVEAALDARITALEQATWPTDPVLLTRAPVRDTNTTGWRTGPPPGQSGDGWRWAYQNDIPIRNYSTIILKSQRSAVYFLQANANSNDHGRLWRIQRDPLANWTPAVCFVQFECYPTQDPVVHTIHLARGQEVTILGRENPGLSQMEYLPLSLSEAFILS